MTAPLLDTIKPSPPHQRARRSRSTGVHRKTLIQWTDETDNIIVVKGGGWWCKKCSPGCANCYAAKLNLSPFFGGNLLPYTGKPPELELRREMIAGWARQRKARKHFVASMTDVFGEWVPQEWIFAMLDGMAAAPRQTFQVLTKRASVMAREVKAWLAARGLARVPANIWLGFSAEDQHWFDARAKFAAELRDVCDVLWCSAEPLLGALVPLWQGFRPDWIVAGGESGPGARECDVEWLRGIACLPSLNMFATMRVFVKQIGKKAYDSRQPSDHRMRFPDKPGDWRDGKFYPNLKHKKGGDMAEWPECLRVREFPVEGM